MWTINLCQLDWTFSHMFRQWTWNSDRIASQQSSITLVPWPLSWTIFKQKGTNITDLESLENLKKKKKLLENHLRWPNFHPVGFSLVTEKLDKISTSALGSWKIYTLATFTQDGRMTGPIQTEKNYWKNHLGGPHIAKNTYFRPLVPPVFEPSRAKLRVFATTRPPELCKTASWEALHKTPRRLSDLEE